MNDLIRCINCDEIFPRTTFDMLPEYELHSKNSLDPSGISEQDDFEAFLRNHHGHRLEDLKILEDSFISEKEYAEPVKTTYFKATNGKESFVVKRNRERVDKPLKYELIHGDYFLKCISIEIQSEEITKQLNWEFKTHPLGQSKIDAFLSLFQHIVKMIDIKNLERSDEESPYPLEIYYKIDDTSLGYLLRNCHNIFDEQEYSNIDRFIQRHKDDGVLLLKATYRIQVNEKDRSRKEAPSDEIPLKVRRIAEKR
jgi:hypothetical protein